MRTAIITGASRGIGFAIAKKLISEGWRVIGLARTFPSDLPSSFIPYVIDLEKIEQLPLTLKELQKKYLDVDAIICNAGRGYFGSLEELKFEKIRSLFELNFLSHTYLIKVFLPLFKRQNRGHIIMLGSEAALQGKRMGSIYCASKFALRGFAQALREECSTSNIRISIINPGMVKTDFFNDLDFAPGDHPSNHILPEDIAEAAHLILNAREGTVFDEINLSPQTKLIKRRTSALLTKY